MSPDGRQGMIEHAEQFAAAGIPFIFDPGQGMPMFDGADLTRFAEQATYCAFNDYEAKLMEERTARAAALAVEAVSDLTGLDIPLTELLENARSIEDSVRDIIESASQMLPAPDDENVTDIDPSFG